VRESTASLDQTPIDSGGRWSGLIETVANGGDEVIVTTEAGLRVVIILEERLLALRAASGGGLRALTDRELEVLRYISEGATGSAVAQRLGLAANTVAQHLVSVRRKLGTTTTAAAIALARDTGLLPPLRG
jgi:DNA-binding CsgD family transcriptional regulator